MTNKEAIEILNDFIDVEGSAVIGMTSLREAIKIAIKAIEERPQGEWIPVSERLPKEDIAVLIWCPDRKNIYCAYLEENQWWIFGAYFEKVPLEVIAWMPLPEADKEADNETN